MVSDKSSAQNAMSRHGTDNHFGHVAMEIMCQIRYLHILEYSCFQMSLLPNYDSPSKPFFFLPSSLPKTALHTTFSVVRLLHCVHYTTCCFEVLLSYSVFHQEEFPMSVYEITRGWNERKRKVVMLADVVVVGTLVSTRLYYL